MRTSILLSLALVATPLTSAAADSAEGRKLVAEKKCETCHHNKTYGDAKSVYLRKDRLVTSYAKLKAQVAACNTQLNLGLFPEEEEHIALFKHALDELDHSQKSSTMVALRGLGIELTKLNRQNRRLELGRGPENTPLTVLARRSESGEDQ